jgi:hypothetical protein
MTFKINYKERKSYKKNLFSRKNNTRKNRTTNKREMFGGSVIASGGFGCIFKPSIKCGNNSLKDDSISKLMLNKYAKHEYNEIQKYKKMLRNIPNYSDYFLVEGFSLCKPKELNKQDLTDFNEKCSALTKKNYSETNINSQIDALMSLNMPYGGVDIDDFIEKTDFSISKMKLLNQTLIQLLKKGILPMNEQHVYHCDLKDSNILVSDKKEQLKTRIIDWGLSTTYHNEKKIPSVLTHRPFQYNIPYSNILFNSEFTKLCTKFLKNNPNPSYLDVRSFVINYVLFWINERGIGHLKKMNTIFTILFENDLINIDTTYKNELIEFNYTLHYIFEYLSQIIYKYIENGKLNLHDYFVNVFLKNIDVWGFTTCYFSLVDFVIDKNNGKIKPNQLKLLNKVKEAYILLIESSDKPVDTEKLISILEGINPLLNNNLKKEFNNKKSTSQVNSFSFNSDDFGSSTISRTNIKKKTTSEKKKTTSKSKTKKSNSKISSI